MNRTEMIKWLSENTTREQWVTGFELPKFKTTLKDIPWCVFRSKVSNDPYRYVTHLFPNVNSPVIRIDDVFEPVNEQPVYIDGGIYEIGVMNGEPQQFVYNLKLNMFERGSNESIGASNVHDSKVVTHFKLVNVPSDTYLTGTGDNQRKPRGLLNHRRERSGSTLNIVKPVGFGAIGDEPDSPSVLDKQEGGSHYKGKGVQPWEVIKSNDMGFFDGNALKYLMRHKDKNGAEDIRKAIHYLEAILEFEYGECDGNVRR
ncbi:hypothetical protein VP142E351_P0024 [Vibrio phage 142E35-1]|nr:hypothetical protein VP142E351_P0024 [Vibrio phage 142E35-1]